MSFEYFNTSHLAFGSKLTRAFRQLEKMCNDAELTIGRYIEDVEYLGEYINKNYRAPFPMSSSNPVRANEIFDVINDEIIIKEISYKDNIFVVSLNYFNRVNNRFTIGKGSTDLKEGYAFMPDSISNMNPTTEIKFVKSTEQGKGKQLFKFRIGSDNNINIVSHVDNIVKFNAGSINHINNIAIGDSLSLPYTATDYEAVIITSKLINWGDNFNVYINGRLMSSSNGYTHRNYFMAYLNPNDTIDASHYSGAYKVIYNRI